MIEALRATSGRDLSLLKEECARLRNDARIAPTASAVIPVNAQEDLDTVLGPLADLVRYHGPHALEVILVINNFDPAEPPSEIELFRQAGVRIVDIPDLWRPGEPIPFTARVPGVRAAYSEWVLLFDGDARIPNPTKLIDWYIDRHRRGAQLAYTHVAYYDLLPRWSVRVRILAHHSARWTKRNVFRIPTTRGSNYAVVRSTFLSLYDRGALTDDLNVGPAIKASGGQVDYSGSRDLYVFTSGRRFKGGWVKLARYLRYRLRYNLKLLSLRPDLDRPLRNPFHQERLR